MFVLSYVFVAATPAHWCATPDLDPSLNLSFEVHQRLTLPPAVESGAGGKAEYSSCTMYDRNYTGWTTEDVLAALDALDVMNDTAGRSNNKRNELLA